MGYLLAFILGGVLATLIVSLFRNEREEIMYGPVKTVVPEQIKCQIHQSFICLNSSNCKGNPNTCGWSVLK